MTIVAMAGPAARATRRIGAGLRPLTIVISIVIVIVVAVFVIIFPFSGILPGALTR